LQGDPAALELVRKAEATVAKVTGDIDERFSFHTAISAVQELVNMATKAAGDGSLGGPVGARALRHAAQTAVSLLFPFAPHVTCEMWQALGGEALWRVPWPQADPSMLERDLVTIVVQVNGKLRERIETEPGVDQAALLERVRALPKVASALDVARWCVRSWSPTGWSTSS